MPKVSVVIPCYNQGRFVNEAVNSVLEQSFHHFEIIIVNDGSSDSFTNNLLKNYNKPKTKVVNTSINKGVSSARNTAIAKARGKYILPLDADDKIGKTYLEKAVKILDTKPKIGIVYCKAEVFGTTNGKWKLPKYKFPNILVGNCIFVSALFRKSDWNKTKGYRTEMKHGFEDWEFWLSLIELGVKVYRIPKVLFYYRTQANSRSKTICKNEDNAKQKIYNFHSGLYMRNIKKIIADLYEPMLKHNKDILFRINWKVKNLKLIFFIKKS